MEDNCFKAKFFSDNILPLSVIVWDHLTLCVVTTPQGKGRRGPRALAEQTSSSSATTRATHLTPNNFSKSVWLQNKSRSFADASTHIMRYYIYIYILYGPPTYIFETIPKISHLCPCPNQSRFRVDYQL